MTSCRRRGSGAHHPRGRLGQQLPVDRNLDLPDYLNIARRGCPEISASFAFGRAPWFASRRDEMPFRQDVGRPPKVEVDDRTFGIGDEKAP